VSTRRTLCRAALASGLAASTLTLASGLWIPVKAEVAQILLERAWHAVRAGDREARPWPWADTSPIARLSIPRLDAAWIVLSGASGRNLAFAPAHLEGSAVPGEPGVIVIAGHRDTHFEILQELTTGMQIVVEDAGGAVHRFEVTAIQIVDSTRSGIRLDSAEPALVLSTCYPFDALTAGGPLRFVVQARPLFQVQA
jgi:sortase A